MTKVVGLTKGYETLVDDEDFDLVNSMPWYASIYKNGVYAARNRPMVNGIRNGQMFMHTFLTGWALVDHIDRNGLNNQRSNLREATQTQNHTNSRKRSDKSSTYKGVYWNFRNRKWIADIRVNGKTTYLGSFVNPIDAALAYDEAARRIHKEFARVNFPREGEVGALTLGDD